jgi:hypothetical protein
MAFSTPRWAKVDGAMSVSRLGTEPFGWIVCVLRIPPQCDRGPRRLRCDLERIY